MDVSHLLVSRILTLLVSAGLHAWGAARKQ